MLESVLADVLTRVLGQYLEGIDRDSVRFGAWSGLVELRGVALRPDALAVLFETLGLHLPVTVNAGFIGLLRLHIPWNSIGTTPVRIDMHDVSIIARPVRGDGSDDNELELRHRRIKRAKLDTDDAVREASWGVTSDTPTSSSWSSWLVSDELRAKIIDNIQIHLRDINIRFEDPFSDPRRPYVISLICTSLRLVSANADWQEAFVERQPGHNTHKLLQVEGFRVDWSPITSRDASVMSSPTEQQSGTLEKRFSTPELLKQFITEGHNAHHSSPAPAVSTILHSVNGSLRLSLDTAPSPTQQRTSKPVVDLDIRFPDITVDLDDVQYACVLQTSVYFARLTTRGYRPKAPKLRWIWAIDQLLPGFSARRARTLRFTEKGIAKSRDTRLVYLALWKSVLKARRTGIEEPKQLLQQLEQLEDRTPYDEIISYRDVADRQIDLSGETWKPTEPATPANSSSSEGTTTLSFWKMLGYTEDSVDEEKRPEELPPAPQSSTSNTIFKSDEPSESSQESSVYLRVAFLLKGASVRLSEKGFPHLSTPRISLNFSDLRMGLLYSPGGEITVEAVLGTIEAWDIFNNTKLAYGRRLTPISGAHEELLFSNSSSYPTDVSEAIDSIRSGSNPAKDLLLEDDESDDEDGIHLPGDSYFKPHERAIEEAFDDELDFNGDQRARSRLRGANRSRDPSPTSTFRVTEAEFFGNPKSSPKGQKYIAAFRYVQKAASGDIQGKKSLSTLDVSVATLEAIVDGPKGSFLWGLKFWQPKGMAQDPIMAFLGATAGARLAEFRMEMEHGLLAHTVPLQINAVILAPRFIIRSPSESAPAIVVNMGTLGVCTSDNAPLLPVLDTKPEKALVRYSNYVLTLDDLGVYCSPDLPTALSQSLDANTSTSSRSDFGVSEQRYVDTSLIERIIRPFSLRFILQTLRDASVAQVAHATGIRNDDETDRLAKFKVRGNIPCLSLVMTKAAFQHLVVTSQRWSSVVAPTQSTGFPSASAQSFSVGWQTDGIDKADPSVSEVSVKQIKAQSDRRASLNLSEAAAMNSATAMASYDVKLMIRKVSVELQDSRDVRLVTAVASRMAANIVKTGRVDLQADFSLQSWSVTDRSRGSTAAFRNLIYAGTLEGSKGVSPPRSTTGGTDFRQSHTQDGGNFVNLRYNLNFAANEQKIHISFRSLNMVCVRETYIRLASFFYGVRKFAQKSRREINENLSNRKTQASDDALSHPSDLSSSVSGLQGFEFVASVAKRRTSITSEFDGFNFQLVASEGAIAVIEMKDSTVHFVRDQGSNMKAWGDFRFFSIRDLTAPIEEHMDVMTYNIQPDSYDDIGSKDSSQSALRKDQWTLSIPTSYNEMYKLNVQFRGIRLSFLYRFSEVIQQYVSALLSGVKPALDIVREDFANQSTADGQQAITTSFASEADRFSIEVDFEDLLVHVPRHSGCASEALNLSFANIIVSNRSLSSNQMEWCVRFYGANFAVNYVLPSRDGFAEAKNVSSPFLSDFEAEMIVAVKKPDTEGASQVSPITTVSLRPKVDIFLQFCEAQYTVLYFVLTENFSESIEGLEIPMDLNEGFANELPQKDVEHDSFGTAVVAYGEVALGAETIPFETPSALESIQKKEKKLDVDFVIPGLRIEISRGWDVTEDACKVVALTMRDIKLEMGLSTLGAMMIELNGHLLSLSDLRPEGTDAHRTFAVPLAKNELHGSEAGDTVEENLTFTFEKDGGPPNVFLFLTGVQMQITPELLRDLTYIAIPGWPYLSTSPFAPDIEYLGRTVDAVLSDSQVVVFAEEDPDDRRALVLTGEFQAKVKWMRETGAKNMSLRSSRLEISTAADLPSLMHVVDSLGRTYLAAHPYERRGSPLMYPTNSFIEYSGPNVDERGRYLDATADSILCLLNVQEVPLLRAVFTRVNRMKDSYLSNRDWKQAGRNPDGESGIELSAKEKQRRQARKSMSVSVQTPVARYLITDEGDGRFVPVLELYFKSFGFKANVPDMVQIESEVFMNLFNSEKGWWEPAIEPWCVAASMSNGLSGSRSVVVQSDQRLDINLTPTTVSAAKTVANALQTMTAKRKVNDSVETGNVKWGTSKNREQLDKSSSPRQPSVAAFLVKNELGVPVMMTLPGSLKRTTIADNAEVEVGVQTEELVSSQVDGEGDARTKALQCSLSIPAFSPTSVSAAEIGIHYLTFYPNIDVTQPQESAQFDPVRVIWEVQMSNGVPVCTIRSLLRVVNQTNTVLELKTSQGSRDSHHRGEEESQRARIVPGAYFALPLNSSNRGISVRPELLNSLRDERTRGETRAQDGTSAYTFEWSPLLPSPLQLFQKAQDAQKTAASSNSTSSSKLLKAITQTGSSERWKHVLNGQLLKCKARQWESSDFFLAVVPAIEEMKANAHVPAEYPWLDICLKAPIILENKLPAPLSYRVSQLLPASSSQARLELEREGAVLAAGVIDALSISHLHFSGESMNSSYLALAYNNDPMQTRVTPTAFGPSVSFGTLGKGKRKAITLAPGTSANGKGSGRKDFRAKISLLQSSVPHFVISTGFWIRNRSDCDLEVCSRSSYYGTGGKILYLQSCLPSEDPNDFLCLEGPYLSIRNPRGEGADASTETLDSSGWWTSTSILDDIQKPMLVGLPGRSLEIELRPALGLGSTTSVITIRNSSWIINNTPSSVQWCQSSALDSHGNCRLRFLNTLPPGNSDCIHWNSKSSEQAVHLRLSEANGQSDWIWSPAIPLDIGHSRELPAKMYRPKSQEQYIARVASKGLEGASRALVIFPEDRLNPPYRIVNFCKERAVAFSQIGSSDRPWLLRAGNTTRYSWDNPLAAPSSRQLSIRIVETDELEAGSSREGRDNASDRYILRHPKCSLNIDVVGDRVKVLSESYHPSIVINVSVDGPTKIVTFCDEDENGAGRLDIGSSCKMRLSQTSYGEEEHSRESVPVVGWDDISHKQEGRNDSIGEQGFSSREYDYPLMTAETKKQVQRLDKKDVDTDAAIFLHSIGMSIVTSEPCELMYMHSKDVRMKYDAYDNLQCFSLLVKEFQIDNQLHTPPFPVMMWNRGHDGSDGRNGKHSARDMIQVEVRRKVTDDDILMIKTLHIYIDPLCLSIDDDLISQVLRFISDTALDGTGSVEVLKGADEDQEVFQRVIGGDVESHSARQEHAVGSGRIYVDELQISATSVRFTSVGSGAALVKAAGITPAARALVALVLNVENCDFELQALHVRNVFDSVHHFANLIKQFYTTQVTNQRMKLLASNALMGNPAALFDSVGTGARDLFNEPSRAKGSVEFVASVGRGSKSLLTHTVGGLVESVSSLPRAVSSGLEKAVGDEEYLAERGRIRGSQLTGGYRRASSNAAQGLATGALSFAHGISSGVTGLVREPVQGARSGGAGGLLKGIGKAFIGGVAKPVAGAIDLVAEPAVGLSRQVGDEDVRPGVVRAPRVFERRKQKRLEVFDSRSAIGMVLLGAVELTSGLVFAEDVVGWVELSDREGGGDGEEWVWEVVQRQCRAGKGRGRGRRLDGAEKTRVGLVTREELIVACMDGRLVQTVRIGGDVKTEGVGMEVVVWTGGDGGGGGGFSAPWDVQTMRRGGGDGRVERIGCGSIRARMELEMLIAEVCGEGEEGDGVEMEAVRIDGREE